MGRSPFFVLIVEPDLGAAASWSEAAARARLDRQVYLVRTAAEAIEYIRKVRGSPTLSTPAIILVQCEAETATLAHVVRWLRGQPALAWVIPVALVGMDRSTEVRPLYDAGARSCLHAPETLEERIRLLEEIRRYWQALNVWPEALPRAGSDS